MSCTSAAMDWPAAIATRPELTAEKFVDPIPSGRGRLYRTGDLVRWRPDGTLEFLGRIDQQVKLRGFRIELGEIETVLGSHPDVAAAVAIVREDAPGDQRLVAYVVPGTDCVIDLGDARDRLRRALPPFMVPNAFVVLDALPTTANGKLDRRALPAPEARRSGAETSYVAPQTPVEEALAAIWAEVLGVERVGIDDDFFDLGRAFPACRAGARSCGAGVRGRDLPRRPVWPRHDPRPGRGCDGGASRRRHRGRRCELAR